MKLAEGEGKENTIKILHETLKKKKMKERKTQVKI